VEEAAEEVGVRCVTELRQQAFLRPWRRRKRSAVEGRPND